MFREIFLILILLPLCSAKLEETIELSVKVEEPIIKCNNSISIHTARDLYEKGETIVFQNVLNNDTLNFSISYWIEDLFGEIVKKKVTTKNLNDKRYTPRFEGKTQILIIKNKLITNCYNQGINTSEKVLIIKNSDFSEKEQTKSSSGSSSLTRTQTMNKQILKTGSIISFYTRVKKYSPIIKLFANIDGTGSIRLLGSETQEIKVTTPQTIILNVSPEKGNNTYYLLLIQDEEIIDSKTLNVNFDNKQNNSKHQQTQTLKENASQDELLSSKSTGEESKSLSKTKIDKVTGTVIYESSQEKKKTIFTPFLIIVTIVLGLFLLKKGFDKFK